MSPVPKVPFLTTDIQSCKRAIQLTDLDFLAGIPVRAGSCLPVGLQSFTISKRPLNFSNGKLRNLFPCGSFLQMQFALSCPNLRLSGWAPSKDLSVKEYCVLCWDCELEWRCDVDSSMDEMGFHGKVRSMEHVGGTEPSERPALSAYDAPADASESLFPMSPKSFHRTKGKSSL